MTAKSDYKLCSDNYATICRLCLESNGYMLAIFNSEELSNPDLSIMDDTEKNYYSKFYIYHKIFEFLQIQVGFEDGLPPNICHRCLYKIELCTDFKKACLQSDAALRHSLNHKLNAKDDLNVIEKRHVVNHLEFEEFNLQNHKFIENDENVENVVTVVDPTAQCDTDNEIDTECKTNKIETNELEAETQHQSDAEIDIATEINEFKNVFMCQYCDRAFINQDMCFLHEQSNHDVSTPFLCQECDMAFGDRVNYTAHLKSVHKNDKPFGCSECDRSFGRRSDLRKHTIVHTGIKPFTCTICLKSFSRNTNLNKHLRIHSGLKPHVCPKCPRTFISKGDLSRHSLIHSGIKPFSCTQCDQSFGRRDKLVRHEKRHMKPENIDKGNISQDLGFLSEQLVQRPFSNEFPGNIEMPDIKQEVDSDQWDSSENMVISLDPYSHNDQMEAESSGYVRSETSLTVIAKPPENIIENTDQMTLEHVTGDDGFPGFSAEEVKMAKSALLKQFICTVCGKKFSNHDSLKLHSATHSALRPHACKICSKTFMRKRELDRHMNTHTGMKPFGCLVCEKKFGRKDKLVRHMRVHDATRHYSCTYCSAKFTRKDGLAHHLKMHLMKDMGLNNDSLELTAATNVPNVSETQPPSIIDS
ncbi:zinc finger protein 883-like [Chrysoperla carnea]|uniref:zinc finger protein 883-like n=1 Tax=Chrysoperla carnea TaxID=189513 RepID=UPI001D0672F0|nr:zinc finger protein 883-like [Chrysoperla carnea]